MTLWEKMRHIFIDAKWKARYKLSKEGLLIKLLTTSVLFYVNAKSIPTTCYKNFVVIKRRKR